MRRMLNHAIKLLFGIGVFCLTTACQMDFGTESLQGPPDKTGFRTWDFADPQREDKLLQGQVWYPIAADSKATPVTESSYRRVHAAIDVPIADGKKAYPLILLSPGFGLEPDSMAWLAEILVANGYIVASVKPTDLLPDGRMDPNFWNRPLDISALLSSLLASELAPSIDSKHIGFVGYDLGALAGIWLAGAVNADLQPEDLVPNKEEVDMAAEDFSEVGEVLPLVDIAAWRKSHRDPRIKAYLLLAPGWAWSFRENDLRKISSEVFIITGNSDQVLSSAKNAIRYAQWIPQARFKEIGEETGHWEFIGVFTQKGYEALRPRLPKSALPSIPLEHRRLYVHEEVGKIAIDYFNHIFHERT